MNKPKFDPNKPYKVANKPKFNPNKPYKAVEKKDTNRWQALQRGLEQGVTFGYGDELGAGVRALTAKATGDERGIKDIYKESLPETRKEYAESRRDYPGTYTVADIGGSMLMPMGKGKLATKVAQGALQGGLHASGRTEGDITDASNLTQTILGAGLGAGGTYLASSLAPKVLRKFAGKKAYQAVKPIKSEVTKLKYSGQKPEEVGGALLDAGVIKPFRNIHEMAAKGKEAISGVGGKISGTLDDVTSVVSKLPTKVQNKILLSGDEAGKILQGVADDMAQSTRYSPSDFTGLTGFAERLAKKYGSKKLTLTDLNKEITELSSLANFDKMATGSNEVLRKARTVLKDVLDAKVKETTEIVGGKALETLNKYKKLYGGLKSGQKLLERAAETDTAKRLAPYAFGTTIGGVGGYARGGDLKSTLAGAGAGLALGSGIRGFNTYAPGVLASGANALATKVPSLMEAISTAGVRGASAPYIAASDLSGSITSDDDIRRYNELIKNYKAARGK